MSHITIPRLVVAGLAGSALALLPAAAHADTSRTSGGAPPSSTTAPERSQTVTITSPVNGSTVAAGPVTVTGTGTPGQPVSVSFQGLSGPDDDSWIAGAPMVGANGTWQLTEPLTEPGTYRVTVRSLDFSSVAQITVTVR